MNYYKHATTEQQLTGKTSSAAATLCTHIRPSAEAPVAIEGTAARSRTRVGVRVVLRLWAKPARTTDDDDALATRTHVNHLQRPNIQHQRPWHSLAAQAFVLHEGSRLLTGLYASLAYAICTSDYGYLS